MRSPLSSKRVHNQPFFTSLYLHAVILTLPTKNLFPELDCPANLGFIKEPRTVLISPKAWAWKVVLIITDSLSLKHKKLAYHR